MKYRKPNKEALVSERDESLFLMLRDYEDWYGLHSLLMRLAEGVSDSSSAERAAAKAYAERMFIDTDEAEVDA